MTFNTIFITSAMIGMVRGYYLEIAFPREQGLQLFSMKNKI